MNEKAEFAIRILKKYASENGEIVRGTTDISPLEEWLIMQLYKQVSVEPEVKHEIADIVKLKEDWYYINNKLQTRERIIARNISQEDAELILTILKMKI